MSNSNRPQLRIQRCKALSDIKTQVSDTSEDMMVIRTDVKM